MDFIWVHFTFFYLRQYSIANSIGPFYPYTLYWILKKLAQPYDLGSMRLLLWDCDDRSYAFDIYVSIDRKNWQLVVRKDELCRSWQFMQFDSRPVVYFQDRSKILINYKL